MREEHTAWLRELERWRSEYEEAIREFARRMLSDLELIDFEDALDRHEAAILAHEDLVVRHEQMIQAMKVGVGPAPTEYEDLHEQLHDRHELSRNEHEKLTQIHREVLASLAAMPKKTAG